MKNAILLASVASAAMLTFVPANAEAQEVIMRRPLNLPTSGAEWQVGPYIIYDRFDNVVQPNMACGPYEQRRDVDCVRKGEIVGDSFCRKAGEKPPESKTEFLDAACTYSWTDPAYVDPGPSCSNSERQTRVVECLRDFDGEKMTDESLCGGNKPDEERFVADHSTCTYSWDQDENFRDPGPSCTAEEVWTKDVWCKRDLDDFPSPGRCDEGEKPPETETKADYSTCTYSWDADDTFLDPGSSCNAREVHTRAVWCKRDLDDNPESDARCNPADRPAASMEVEDYSACSYEWDESGYVDPDGPSCNANEVRTQTVTCLQSDGQTVGDEKCSGEGPKPSETKEFEDFRSCSYAWHQSGFNNPGGASCNSAETQTQTVTCRRSNGQTVADSFCAGAGTKPSSSRVVQDYDACGYRWDESGWSNPGGASCVESERQTQTVTCRRVGGEANNEIAPDSSCSHLGTKPSSTRDVPDYASCSYDWDAGNWNNPGGASCTDAETRTRSVVCRRSNGTAVADSFCSGRGTKPVASQTFADTDACTYRWDEGGWGSWSSNCSTSATRTQTVRCLRSDDKVMTGAGESNCTATKPLSSQTDQNYAVCTYSPNYGSWSVCDGTSRSRSITSCTRVETGQTLASSECTTRGSQTTQTESCLTYSWVHNGYGSWDNTCSSTAKRPYNYSCRASNNTYVADSFCSGSKPTQTQTDQVYSGCDYTAVNWGGWVYDSTCSTNTSRTRTADCRRGDGTIVSDSYCTDRSVSLSQTQNNQTNISGCSYAAYNWTNPANPTCSAANTETQTADCRRQDGTIVSDSECTSRGVSLTRTVDNNADYSGCGYSATNWTNPANPTCSAANTETQTADCRRSDGTIVSDSNCTSRGISLTRTQSNNADYSGCTYSATNWTNPANPTCSAANTETQTADCRRSDGTIVSDSNCTNRSISLTRTVSNNADYSGCGYSATNWTNPANPTCSAANTETQTADCRRDDGTIVSDSNCTSRGISLTRTVNNNADYSGCGYSAVNWTGTNPQTSCSDATTYTETASCRRADGTIVSGSECTSRGIAITRTTNAPANYSGCTYKWNYGNYGSWSSTCSTSATRTRSATCYRIETSANVSDSYCSGLTKDNQQGPQGVYTSCTYTASYGGWSSCNNSKRTASMTGCTRNGVNQNVSVSYCKDFGLPDPKEEACSMPAGTGPILRQQSNGGAGSYCLEDITRTSGQSGFPAWCGSLGGTYYQRVSTSCERTRDPYGPPWEQEYDEICREY